MRSWVSACAMSPQTNSTRAPRACRPATVSTARSSSRMSLISRSNPACARAYAMARPIPRRPPVTMAARRLTERSLMRHSPEGFGPHLAGSTSPRRGHDTARDQVIDLRGLHPQIGQNGMGVGARCQRKAPGRELLAIVADGRVQQREAQAFGFDGLEDLVVKRLRIGLKVGVVLDGGIPQPGAVKTGHEIPKVESQDGLGHRGRVSVPVLVAVAVGERFQPVAFKRSCELNGIVQTNHDKAIIARAIYPVGCFVEPGCQIRMPPVAITLDTRVDVRGQRLCL